MEQLIPANDNTVTQSFFTFTGDQDVFGDSHRLSLLQSLLTTPDSQSLLDSYREELQQWLVVSSVELISNDSQARSGRALTSLHYVDFPCERIGDSDCSLRYGLKKRPSVWQSRLLSALHDTAQLPLQGVLQRERLQKQARQDYLTSLGNRAYYDDSIETFLHRAERTGASFGLLVLDLDKFKQVNDAHGHCEGDTVLVALASAIRRSLRGTDQAFRLGGDEFCCLIDDGAPSTLQAVAERIRHNMHCQPVLRKHNITCSIGTSSLEEGDDATSLFERADKALYREKQF